MAKATGSVVGTAAVATAIVATAPVGMGMAAGLAGYAGYKALKPGMKAVANRNKLNDAKVATYRDHLGKTGQQGQKIQQAPQTLPVVQAAPAQRENQTAPAGATGTEGGAAVA